MLQMSLGELEKQRIIKFALVSKLRAKYVAYTYAASSMKVVIELHFQFMLEKRQKWIPTAELMVTAGQWTNLVKTASYQFNYFGQDKMSDQKAANATAGGIPPIMKQTMTGKQ